MSKVGDESQTLVISDSSSENVGNQAEAQSTEPFEDSPYRVSTTQPTLAPEPPTNPNFTTTLTPLPDYTFVDSPPVHLPEFTPGNPSKRPLSYHDIETHPQKSLKIHSPQPESAEATSHFALPPGFLEPNWGWLQRKIKEWNAKEGLDKEADYGKALGRPCTPHLTGEPVHQTVYDFLSVQITLA